MNNTRLRHTTSMIGLLGALLLLAGGCTDNEAGEYPVRDMHLTMKCGTDVSLRFNVSGHIGLLVQDMLASKCRMEGSGNNMTIQCPGNGLNWTRVTEERFSQLTAPNPYAFEEPQAASNDSAGNDP
jgi:hypothetical protein